jgi:aryl-alcohol dehydrogenase-like predicted oxidoreductase
MNHSAKRTIGPFQVNPIGLGCMNLSHAYGEPPAKHDAQKLLLSALDHGCDFFDTAALYGFGANETLVGETLKSHRREFVLASKGGMTGVMFPDGIKRVIDGRPASIKQHCEDSLKRLQTDVIDIYYLHRWDKSIPIQESVGAMADLLRAGKIRAIGLSEISAPTLIKAHAEHPIAAVQTEYSAWTRNPEIAVLKVCESIGATFVAFSPIGRGFLTDAMDSVLDLGPKDLRRTMPRFAPEQFEKLGSVRNRFRQLAKDNDLTAAQLALSWVLSRSPKMTVIPGTTRLNHLMDNLDTPLQPMSVTLSQTIDALLDSVSKGTQRYNESAQADVDTEQFN